MPPGIPVGNPPGTGTDIPGTGILDTGLIIEFANFLESRDQVFNENLSERDNMINNGYRIYYDTGNLVYHKNY